MALRASKLTVWLAAAVVVLLVVSLVVPAKLESGWVDPVTGTTRYETRWLGCFSGTPTIERTALDAWLVREEGLVTYDWRQIVGTSGTIWGRAHSRGHGRAPEVLSLRGELMTMFVKASSDDELRRFVDTMRHGTRSEQRDAVNRAFETAIEGHETIDTPPSPSHTP